MIIAGKTLNRTETEDWKFAWPIQSAIPIPAANPTRAPAKPMMAASPATISEHRAMP